MNCDTALEQMSAMLDGELPQSARAQMLAHLASCERCRAVYDGLCAADAALAMDQQEPPAALRAGVMQAIRAEAPRRGKRRTGRYIVAALAAAAAVFIMLSGLGVVDLPGMAADGRASVSVGQSLAGLLEKDPSGEAAELAAQIAAERNAPVLLVCGDETPDELKEADYETLGGGARLYAVEPETLEWIRTHEDEAQLFVPQEQPSAKAAYVLLAK